LASPGAGARWGGGAYGVLPVGTSKLPPSAVLSGVIPLVTCGSGVGSGASIEGGGGGRTSRFLGCGGGGAGRGGGTAGGGGGAGGARSTTPIWQGVDVRRRATG